MQITFAGEDFDIILGSDVVNDGMYLEAQDMQHNIVLYAFFSDVNGEFTLSAYCENLPFELVEMFVAKAREILPAPPGTR